MGSTQSTWGQIKNIKLHIVTDIKVDITMLQHGLPLDENALANASLAETQQKIQNMYAALNEKDLGNKAYKSKNFPKAHHHYGNAIDLDPDNIVFYTNKSAVLFEEEKYDECVELCRKAVAVGRENRADPTLVSKPLARMGRVHVKRGEYELGVEMLELSLVECEVESVVKEVERIKKILQEQ